MAAARFPDGWLDEPSPWLDSIDAGARRMDILIDDHERGAVHGRNRRPGTAQGALTKYARLVGQAPGGAVCGPGGRVDGMSPNAS
jgi:hypothetical protein